MVIRLTIATLLALVLGAGPALAAQLDPDLASLASVPRVSLPAVALSKALAAEPKKNRPFQFAVGVATDFTLAHGAWDTLPDGTRRWRLRLDSPGAKSLSLHFFPFDLPPGASLWIYAADGSLVQGPWRAANATPGGLWTPSLPQDSLVIEARVPAAQASQLRLGIAAGFHGFRDWKDAGVPAKSGSCNIDVACPTDGVWADEIRSVALIEFGQTNRYLCSGQLLNNTEQDLDPLFITADHCGIGPGPNDESPDSVVLYWNYQRSQCRGSAAGSIADTQSGSTFLADDAKADFTLLHLNASPNAFGVFYAGWNAEPTSNSGSNCGVAIHHPSGDEKAISFYQTAINPEDDVLIEIQRVNAWRVPRWAYGTTEQGSSGSGLWNSRHELIGVLSGGDAACTNRSGSDFFGRLESGWAPMNSTASGQLRAHLDPNNLRTTGNLHIPGLDPGWPEPLALDAVSTKGCGSPGPLAPVAGSDNYSTTVGAALNVPAPGVLENDSDPNGDIITAQFVSTTASGTLSLSGDGSFRYTPNAGFKGTDQFSYRASDGSLTSASTLVRITVGTATIGGGGGGGGLGFVLLPLLLAAGIRIRA